ncbi:MAG: hypothetical protein R3C26_01910 [Calditrichia bacterium]
MAELLKFRFFRRDGYAFSEATIAKALRENANIIAPRTEELSQWNLLSSRCIATRSSKR